jgi:hypothetical protein
VKNPDSPDFSGITIPQMVDRRRPYSGRIYRLESYVLPLKTGLELDDRQFSLFAHFDNLLDYRIAGIGKITKGLYEE